MIFKFEPYVLDVDLEATRAFYSTAPLASEDCGCLGCRNYESAMDALPKETVSFFSQLGIEMKKPRDAYVNMTNADESVLYGGWYHISGQLIEGGIAWEPTAQGWRLGEKEIYTVLKSFRIWFKKECTLLPDSLPPPAIELEFTADIPWVLDEPNSYEFDMRKKNIFTRLREKLPRYSK